MQFRVQQLIFRQTTSFQASHFTSDLFSNKSLHFGYRCIIRKVGTVCVEFSFVKRPMLFVWDDLSGYLQNEVMYLERNPNCLICVERSELTGNNARAKWFVWKETFEKICVKRSLKLTKFSGYNVGVKWFIWKDEKKRKVSC